MRGAWRNLSLRKKRIIASFILFMTNDLVMNVVQQLLQLDCDEPGGVERAQSFEGWRNITNSSHNQGLNGLLLLFSVPTLLRWLSRFRRTRRFWSAPRGAGVWELQFLGTFRLVGRRFADWEDDRYMEHFRVSKEAFFRLHRKYGRLLERQVTRLRNPVPSDKRLAITLHYLSHGGTFAQLGLLFSVGRSTAAAVVHSTIKVFCEHMVDDSIMFPDGAELDQVIHDFEALACLPQCAGAVDGTFIRIKKPDVYGDSYWCYKNHIAILLLAAVDARGIFTYVNAGNPGSVGDAAAYNSSALYSNIKRRKWLCSSAKLINGVETYPYIVGDSAFALSDTLMKCYTDDTVPRNKTFNFRLIRTRRVVEQAFGRMKGRYHVLFDNFISDPSFASDITIVCCALHNICERWSCPFDDTWLINPTHYTNLHPPANAFNNNAVDAPGIAMRHNIADYLHATSPIE